MRLSALGGVSSSISDCGRETCSISSQLGLSLLYIEGRDQSLAAIAGALTRNYDHYSQPLLNSRSLEMAHSPMDHGHMDHGDHGDMDMGDGQCSMNVRLPFRRD